MNALSSRKETLVTLLAGLVLLALALSAAARFWGGYASPEACLEALTTAACKGDAEGYLGCLAEPLRSDTRRRLADEESLAAWLRREWGGVQSTANTVDWSEPSTPVGAVEAVRAENTRRYRIRFRESLGRWLIAGITQAGEADPPIHDGATADNRENDN